MTGKRSADIYSHCITKTAHHIVQDTVDTWKLAYQHFLISGGFLQTNECLEGCGKNKKVYAFWRHNGSLWPKRCPEAQKLVWSFLISVVKTQI